MLHLFGSLSSKGKCVTLGKTLPQTAVSVAINEAIIIITADSRSPDNHILLLLPVPIRWSPATMGTPSTTTLNKALH
ncbi:hypothetical protein J6590_068399 [Homalodisca vitripennis]|nr:hypothetical protein J6590_068399 [Homalodisca vitripennis]